MEKFFKPNVLEKKWYKIWEEGNYFSPNIHINNKTYCIMIPPPNITGSLHMGHAFQDTIIDILIRYHRMKGCKTLWQMGTDHAGIATQMIVDRKLQQDGISRYVIGRDKFVEKIWQWEKQSSGIICKQLRYLGASIDWSRKRFTMDIGFSKAVQMVFIQLYKEGLIYRGKRLVNWDPVLKTAISDLEVNFIEEKGYLWHVLYPIVNSKEYLTVATTRPETILADTALAVHPDDVRYHKFIGQKVILPFTDRKIPVIEDNYVNKEFGTGCMKITPAHDFNDYIIGERHNLEKINIFTTDAKINKNAPKQYQGMDRFDARQQIVKDLKENNLLSKVELHNLKVPRGDRTQTIIEPYLTDQWFVKTKPLVQPAIDAVMNGDIKFIPQNWNNTYFQWLKGIQDWCISRQLWWGHRIPAWYDQDGNIYVGEDEITIRKEYCLCKEIQLIQDSDVLDTWFSSALWPFSSLGWPKNTLDLKNYYPTNVLVTGFDIIFFWVARMIMFGLKFTGKVPFKEIYIHGLIQDYKGKKMSKSQGNIIDPLDLINGIKLDNLIQKRTNNLMNPKMAKQIAIDTKQHFPNGIPKYGTDALRFTYCAMANNNRHLKFDLKKLTGYRNFCTKIWNAARYVITNTKGIKANKNVNNIINRWILSCWQQIKKNFIKNLHNYRFDLAAYDIYDFIWNTFCDWYLELSKVNMITDTKENLKFILGEIMQLLHPIMPFITEEIWQLLGNKKYLITHTYPKSEQVFIDQYSENLVHLLKSIIISVRNFRGEMDISPNKELNIMIQPKNQKDVSDINKIKQILNNYTSLIRTLAKVTDIHMISNNSSVFCYISSHTNSIINILIPIDGIIDKKEAISKINTKCKKLINEIHRIKSKIENVEFIKNAPHYIQNKEKNRLKKCYLQQTSYINFLQILQT